MLEPPSTVSNLTPSFPDPFIIKNTMIPNPLLKKLDVNKAQPNRTEVASILAGIYDDVTKHT